MKLDLQNKFRMSGNWIENTLKWLRKKAENKSATKKKFLQGKFDFLINEKKNMKSVQDRSKSDKETNRIPEISTPLKKIVYNNSSKALTAKQEKLLELGLNFAVTPKKFPLVEYIAATENLCQAQKIRNMVLNHIRKGVGMRIKDKHS